MNKYILSLFMLAAPILTCAQDIRSAGNFSSEVADFRTILLDKRAGIIAASASLVINGCSGSVEGIGKISGNKLKFTPYSKVAGGENCE